MASRKRSPTRNLQEQYMKAKMYGEYRRTRREGAARFDWTHIPVIMEKEKPKNPVCPSCNYLGTIKNGFNSKGIQRYKCKHCDNVFFQPPVKKEKEKPKNPKCDYCGYLKTTKAGCNIWGNQRYKCKSCERTFTDRQKPVEVKIPKKADEKIVKVRTLDDLRREKELKDLKAEITKKDVQISKLKTKIKKLNGQLISPEQDKKRKRQIYIENPDFLEIS